MIDKWFSASSFLALRFTEKPNVDFSGKLHYRHPDMPSESNVTYVYTADDIDRYFQEYFEKINSSNTKLGILLSGGMDSGILASYCSGIDAYSFRFMNGLYQKEELCRAEQIASHNKMNLHYCDIDWSTVSTCLRPVMMSKGGPVHSIEPQIYQAAMQAKSDGVELMIIGDASDYIFGGMDKLLSKDWTYEEFIKRYIYIDPFEVLTEPCDIQYVFEDYRSKTGINVVKLLNRLAAQESYGSYNNAFVASHMNYLDPYENLRMAEPLDLNRIRNGESKYLIRDLFKIRYPTIPVPEKLPMPRPVDAYFANWEGPKRPEFKANLDIYKYNGNQKWLIWCLEQFFELVDHLS